MILKKPYAFLIKYFKLIHVVLVLLMSYLLYRTNVIFNFFQEYINSNQLIIGKDFTGTLFNYWMFAIPFIIIVVLLILLGVMYYKKKPMIYYIYNILVMIFILIIYNVGYDIAGTLEMQTVETRVLRLVRDFFIILTLFQGVGLIFTFIRATGFDIKKFDFVHDLEELDITEADSEEFEVDVDIETNILKREVNKTLRFAKYVYLENRFIINIIFLIVFSTICFTIYMNLTIYNKTYNQNDMFLSSEFKMSVSSSYLTNENYNGEYITDNYLVLVELNIKANSTNDVKLNTTKSELKVSNHTYYPNDKYKASLIDLGNIYDDTTISESNFQKKLLVYEIPKSLIKEKMIFSYIDKVEVNRQSLNPKYINVKINPYNLDSSDKLESVDLNESKDLNRKILKNTNFLISSFEIKEKFKLDYKYCDKNDCYDSFEYLNPTLDTNYNKVLMKIEGNADIDSELKNKNIYDFYSIIRTFGKIRYKINGKVKYYNNLKRVIPDRVSLENACYIEVPKEVMDADDISLIIDIRDKSYEYTIK